MELAVSPTNQFQLRTLLTAYEFKQGNGEASSLSRDVLKLYSDVLGPELPSCLPRLHRAETHLSMLDPH